MSVGIAGARQPRTAAQPRTAPISGRWPLWGVAAGLLGIIATMLTDHSGAISADDYLKGAALMDELDRTRFHIGVVAGFFAVAAVLFTAAGWRRWAELVAPESIAARVVSMALTAGAGAMMLGYGFKGSLAVYLNGGMDEGSHTNEGLYSIFMFLDFGPYIAWWGAAIAAAVVAWLALRDRLLPIWIGVVSAVFFLLPVGLLVATGLPGFPGVVDQAWLMIVSTGLLLSRPTAHRTASA